MKRTFDWSILLNQVPTWFGGGAEGLKNSTLPEWNLIRSNIDAGRPWPIGLIYTGRNVWDQHQILVYGYENTGANQGKLFVYDSNAPAQFGETLETLRSEVKLDFRGPTLVAESPSDFGDKLAGFFCSNYFPTAPVGMSKNYGEFLSWAGDPRTWMVTDGARMQVADSIELSALGGTPTSVRATGSAFIAQKVRPRDGACFRERSSSWPNAPTSDSRHFGYSVGLMFWM